GTLTIGRPLVRTVHVLGSRGPQDVLRLAAAVEQSSSHLLARSIVDAAHEQKLLLSQASDVVEYPGRGVSGQTEGHLVTVGALSLVNERVPEGARANGTLATTADRLTAYVAVDGEVAGAIEYADELRGGLDAFFADLRSMGIRRLVLLSGDREDNVRAVAAAVGITEARGDLLPADKVAVVEALMAEGERVLMVGDGTNDAPALSTAAVGVALGSRSEGITTEAANVVILADDVTRVAEALHIGRETLRITRQSIAVGLGLSAIAMVFAAAGQITPAVGALLQEGIDVAVILNALRTSRS
ncbi:MAG: HAD-IC family P-type ATPase, partial [Gemmatimonadaceae bacterium]